MDRRVCVCTRAIGSIKRKGDHSKNQHDKGEGGETTRTTGLTDTWRKISMVTRHANSDNDRLPQNTKRPTNSHLVCVCGFLIMHALATAASTVVTWRPSANNQSTHRLNIIGPSLYLPHNASWGGSIQSVEYPVGSTALVNWLSTTRVNWNPTCFAGE